MLKIGFIDKYPVALKGMRVLLEDHFNDVKLLAATSVLDLRLMSGSGTLDVLIIGYDRFTTASWLSIFVDVKRLCPNAPVILIDEVYQTGKIEVYFKAGVMGNILKCCPELELIRAIKSVLAGKRYISPELHYSVLGEIAHRQQGLQSLEISPTRLGLTAREAEIAHYLAQGMGTKFIANLTKTNSSTISAIKRRVLKKMKSDNVIELARKMSTSSS